MNVKELRATTGLSQKKFADPFRIPVRTLQEWEQGRQTPTEYVVFMMERILELEGKSALRFRDEQHKQDFHRFLDQMENQDCYHRAVAYLLSLDVVVVRHAEDVFDFAGDCIKQETALQHGWQTDTSRKTTRLLMNLWNGWSSEYDDEGESTPSPGYAVDEIFCCSYAPYYWEAIKLRYPEYCND